MCEILKPGFGIQTSALGTRNPAKNQNASFAVPGTRIPKHGIQNLRLTANTIFTILKVDGHQLKFTTSIEKGKQTNKKQQAIRMPLVLSSMFLLRLLVARIWNFFTWSPVSRSSAF